MSLKPNSRVYRHALYQQFISDKAHGEVDNSIRSVEPLEAEYRSFQCEIEIDGKYLSLIMEYPSHFPWAPPSFSLKNFKCDDFDGSWNPSIRSMCATLLMMREIVRKYLNS